MASNHSSESLSPPFKHNEGLFSWPENHDHPNHDPSQQNNAPKQTCLIPSLYKDKDSVLQRVDGNLTGYIKQDLIIHEQVYDPEQDYSFTGLAYPARALNYHSGVKQRPIAATEHVDLHLKYNKSCICIKPLPDYLMCFDVWRHVICTENNLHSYAVGFLYSYLRLILHETDLRIAHENGLISREISWKDWTKFGDAVANCIDLTKHIYKEMPLIWNEDEDNPLRPSKFFAKITRKNLILITATTVYIGLALTAMQVGLATDRLSTSRAFQDVSYGFTVFAIAGPLILLVINVLIWAGWNCWFWPEWYREVRTRKKRNRPQLYDKDKSPNNQV